MIETIMNTQIVADSCSPSSGIGGVVTSKQHQQQQRMTNSTNLQSNNFPIHQHQHQQQQQQLNYHHPHHHNHPKLNDHSSSNPHLNIITNTTQQSGTIIVKNSNNNNPPSKQQQQDVRASSSVSVTSTSCSSSTSTSTTSSNHSSTKSSSSSPTAKTKPNSNSQNEPPHTPSTPLQTNNLASTKTHNDVDFSNSNSNTKSNKKSNTNTTTDTSPSSVSAHNGQFSSPAYNNMNQANNNGNGLAGEDVKVQVYYCGLIMVVYIKETMRLDSLLRMLREICSLDPQQLFTVKWVDEEGDPCTLSSQLELNEALRLYSLNKESELVMHVFANIPEWPGTQCAGEDRSIYRRGARRWRKIYLVNGHKYQAKRFARTALCKVCNERIWGLGRQGYKCLECKIMVHKRCHKYISMQCAEIQALQHSQQQQALNSYLTNNSTNSKIANQGCTTTAGQSQSSQEMTYADHHLKTNGSVKSDKHKNSLLLDDHKQQTKHAKAIRHHEAPEQSSSSSETNNVTATSNNNNNNKSHARNGSTKKSFNSLTKAATAMIGAVAQQKNISTNSATSSGPSTASAAVAQQQKELHKEDVQLSLLNELEVGEMNNSGSNDTQNVNNIEPQNNQQKTKKNTSSSQGDKAVSQKTAHIGLDQFDLIKVVGRGSYAKVFLVEYKKTRKCYAMKVIKKSIVDDDEDIDWVQTEKHVFEQATNHPFLVGLHSCFQTESRLFFVIEYLCGGDLMYHMQRKRRLPEDHARFYSAEIAIALGYLHSKGIIYRDLKLDNVLLDIEGHVKLTDYGMCKEGLSKTERTSTFCGTPNYIAPEMLRGEDYDFSVDWWALGVLLYEMMAGRSPFEPINDNPGDNPDLNTEDHLFQVILEKPIRIPRSLSVKAASVLKGFLQKSPDERLASYDGLNEIKQHLFFKPIDWNLLEQRLIQPPYKPPVQSERDLGNIDELFTREPVLLTPDSPNTLARIQQNEFDGFEYINPLILSDELPV